MEIVVANREMVDAWRSAIARERDLFEVRRVGDEVDWRAVNGAAPFDWNAPLALAGAKRFFLPPRETLFRWHGDAVEEEAACGKPFALFGLRSCDLTAIAYQDRFFATDAWYQRRRGRGLLIGLDCLTACPGGFCRDVDAGPFAHSGFDANLTPLDDGRVLIHFATDRGRALFAAAGIQAPPADPADRAAAEAAEVRACESFPPRRFVGHAIERLNAHAIEGGEWQDIGPSCFACTGCTNLCPTCSCFTVVDDAREGGGERMRVWDSCLLEGFQREASGHDPAPRPGDRVRRFWYHKLSRDFVADCGRLGCVGCGRCDVTCPGSIGALNVLRALGSQ